MRFFKKHPLAIITAIVLLILLIVTRNSTFFAAAFGAVPFAIAMDGALKFALAIITTKPEDFICKK